MLKRSRDSFLQDGDLERNKIQFFYTAMMNIEKLKILVLNISINWMFESLHFFCRNSSNPN